ncbi:hypothetical protein BASA81_006808 [Batrachochytrium salamandrivorans]|nr:hypothetical protein BASA81_006808 [Batrachochytrium salamandrivorans]
MGGRSDEEEEARGEGRALGGAPAAPASPARPAPAPPALDKIVDLCRKFSNAITQRSSSTKFIQAFSAELNSLYSQGISCPPSGLGWIATCPDSALLVQSMYALFVSTPPTKFFFALLHKLKEFDRLDVLYGLGERLKPLLVNSSNVSEFGKVLRFGLCHRLVVSQEDVDLFKTYSWAQTNGARSFPWFEGTLDFTDQSMATQRVQLTATGRTVARPARLVLHGEEFKGMHMEGQCDLVLRSTLDASRKLQLVWNSGELVGSLIQHEQAILPVLAKELVSASSYLYEANNQHQPQRRQLAQCLLLQDDGAYYQTHLTWPSEFNVWVWLESSATLVSSRSLTITVDAKGEIGVNGSTNIALKLPFGEWTKLSCQFLQGELVVSVEGNNNHGKFEWFGAPEDRELVSWGIKGRCALFDLVMGELDRYPLVCYRGATTTFVDLLVNIGAVGECVPLIFWGHSSKQQVFVNPPPICTYVRECDMGVIPFPFTGLQRGFLAKLCFSPSTAGCTLVVQSSGKQLVVALVRRGDVAELKIEYGGHELATIWNVELSLDGLVVEFNGSSLTIARVCRVPLCIAESPFFFVRAKLAAGDGELTRFAFQSLSSPIDDATVFTSAPSSPPLLPPPQEKVCATCTYANAHDAKACAVCEGKLFIPTAPVLAGKWDSAWNAFRDEFLLLPSLESNAKATHAWQSTCGGEEPLLNLEMGERMVVFPAQAMVNDMLFPALVHLDDVHWHVQVDGLFNLHLDAQGKQVLYHSLGWDFDRPVFLRELVRTSQVGLQNMTPGLVNVCFQNSVLQCLFALKSVRQDLVLNHGGENNGALLGQLKGLFQVMTASPLATHATSLLQQALPTRFREGRQMDAQEFLIHVIGELEHGAGENRAVLDAVMAVQTWQDRTCLKCNETREDAKPALSHTGLVLNLPRQFSPVTNIRLVVCFTSQDLLPRCGEHEVRLLPNLGSFPNGPFCYLYIERAPGQQPVTNISSKPLPNGEEINTAGVRLYLTRELSQGPPITDLDLIEANNANAGLAGVMCGKQFKLVSKSTMPITHIAVGVGGGGEAMVGYTRITPALGENACGDLVYLFYSCAFGRLPITRFSAFLATGEEEDGEEESVAMEIDGRRWVFSQSAGVGCPITQLTVQSNGGIGEVIELQRAEDNPIWRISATTLSMFSTKQFTQKLGEECEVHVVSGGLDQLLFEDGVVYTTGEEESKITLVAKIRADGAVQGQYDSKLGEWKVQGQGVFYQPVFYQLEFVNKPQPGHRKVLEWQNYTLYGRMYQLNAKELPINGVYIQLLVGEADPVQPGYREVCVFQGEDGLKVRLCTTSSQPNATPIRDIALRDSPTTLGKLVDLGEFAQGKHLVVEHGDKDNWSGTFVQFNERQLRTLKVATKTAPTKGRKVEFAFGNQVFHGACIPDKVAWGVIPRTLPNNTINQLFMRVDWEAIDRLRMKTHYGDFPCMLLLDTMRIVINRDCCEYWSGGDLQFTSRVTGNSVRQMFTQELSDSYVLLGANMATCESGKHGCVGALQPHLSRKRVGLPITLLVHLNRMRFEHHRTVKDHTITPLECELNHLGSTYCLLAVVSHIGSSAESGHYRAYCRYSTHSQAWFLLDDAKVTDGLGFSDLIHRFECQHKLEETPYLLFYAKLEQEEGPQQAVREQALVEAFLQRYSASRSALEAARLVL